MISRARIRTICSWLPTLDEARLREVEDFVLAKAIEQQDSAPADTVAPHDGERTHGGNLSAAGRHGARRDDATPLDPGHETPTGGDSSDCECGDEPWLRHRVDDRAESHMPWCPARIEAGLREPAAATPVKAAAPGILLDFDMSDIGDEP